MPEKSTEWVEQIKTWGGELGFSGVSIASIDLAQAEKGLVEWLEAGFHGEMDYMARHGMMRARPAELLPGTVSVISVRMNYWPEAFSADVTLANKQQAYISRYALGRDYHKVLRQRLQRLAERISSLQAHAYRVFVDSAPVMEVALATQSGAGWRGKHTLTLNRQEGSYFFLGEIFTDLALPPDQAVSDHCGRCEACINACPTGAIVAPYRLDARKCISYLTIELKGSIPEEMRPLLGNRIYGCDDCQLVCPWNRFGRYTIEPDFAPRHGLDNATLIELFMWSEEQFKARLSGSAIYRLGYERWLRNIAVALGNAIEDKASAGDVIAALQSRIGTKSDLVREHIEWALRQYNIY